MLRELPRQCDTGAKTSGDGHPKYWQGYKLHLDVADGQIPIRAILTSASLHDSQAAIPLTTMTSRRVTYCYDLMDAAYDAQEILEHCRKSGARADCGSSESGAQDEKCDRARRAAARTELGRAGTL